ncbi:MAG: Citrate lyase subunit beta [Candidatus Dichloromethanomonas elyunquensis]|nr:MAG: Citrate lyase subunit beta [Candidatus Dichloromethanomonas elyunquensis]
MEGCRRSMLFMPGNNPGMLQSAGVFSADSIIFDLEDGVSLQEKDSARLLLRNALQTFDYGGTEVVVRVNNLTGSPYGLADVEVIAPAGVAAIMLPKATEKEIILLDKMLAEIETKTERTTGSTKIFPLIETAYGLMHLKRIISSSIRIAGVLLGAEDLTADLGIKRTRDGEEIFMARCQVAIACRAAGIDAIDTPFADVQDQEGLIKDTQKAKALGLTGKAAINPRQIGLIHEVFAPSPEEVLYAREVITAMQEAEKEGKGVFSLHNKMIDAPIISRAQAVLAKARQYGWKEGENHA